MKSLVKGLAAAACGLLLSLGTACANGLQVTNVWVSARDDTTAYVTFDITWQHAWRYTNINHDAAWVFFKVRPEGSTVWQHVTLEGSGVNPPTYSNGEGTAVDLIVPEDRVGLFVRRAEQGSGTLAVTNVQAVWNIASNSLAKTSRVHIWAQAVEMVYVAEGAFKVGSGGTEDGSLTDGSWTSGATIPLQINGEGELMITNAAGYLWGTSTSGKNTIGGAGTLSAAFPKGYAAFYCMKHEVTQGQYVDFLNALIPAQAANRYYAGTTFRYTLSVTNGVYVTAHPDRVCGRLGYPDGAAYMDWAGLRPRTELEFEKSCRGPLNPVANEYPWGTTAISMTTAGLTNDGVGTDTVNNGNCNHGSSSLSGPYRAGIYATAVSSREAAGASYWGILDLGGSMWEQVVTVGNATGRAFTGLHGDGKLDANGNANVTAWPGTTAVGIGFRGCGFHDAAVMARVCDRRYCGGHDDPSRSEVCGCRAVRTAPVGVLP